MSEPTTHAPSTAAPALAIAKAGPTPQDRYRATIENLAQRELVAMAGDAAGRQAAAGFALAFRQAAVASPAIYECSPASVGQALALSLLTRLMPGGPLPAVYLIPRRIKDVQTLQWQVSWRGLQILAARAGYRIRAGAVVEGDQFRFRDGATQELEHVPAEDREELTFATWEKLRGVWVVANEVLPGGGERLAGMMFVPRRKIEARRAHSDSWKRYQRDGKACPWTEWPDEQSLKTGVRYAIARGLVQLDEIGAAAYQHDGTQDAPDDAAPALAEATQAMRAALPASSGPANLVRERLGMPALEATVESAPVEEAAAESAPAAAAPAAVEAPVAPVPPTTPAPPVEAKRARRTREPGEDD